MQQKYIQKIYYQDATFFHSVYEVTFIFSSLSSIIIFS